MKKLVVLVFTLCLFPLQAGAWGLQISMGDKTSLLFKYLGQTEVIQPVCVLTYADGEYFPGLPADSRVSQEKLVEHMEKGINYWFTKSREFLQNSGRAEEFADVLAVLPQTVTLQLQADCTQANTLRLIYAPRAWYVDVIQAAGMPVEVRHKAHYTVPRIRTSDEIAFTETHHSSASVTLFERLDLINLPQVLAHEAGHLLGLADQYGFASYLTPGENMSSHFSYFHVIGNNTQALNQSLKVRRPATLMGAPRFHAQALARMWPDDVDALINAVDFVQIYHKDMLSPRVVNGWKSFSLQDKRVGYAFAMPFQYTAQNALPDDVLIQATGYAYQSKIGGLTKADLALLQRWYVQTGAPVAYTHMQAQDLHQWQQEQLAQREVTTQLRLGSPVEAIPLSTLVGEPRLSVTLPDLIQLRIPTAQGQTRTLSVVHQDVTNDPDCNFYMIVTDKEMTWFQHEYGSVLNRVNRKQAAQKKLTRKETRIANWYEQMKENQRKTAKCQAVSH